MWILQNRLLKIWWPLENLKMKVCFFMWIKFLWNKARPKENFNLTSSKSTELDPPVVFVEPSFRSGRRQIHQLRSWTAMASITVDVLLSDRHSNSSGRAHEVKNGLPPVSHDTSIVDGNPHLDPSNSRLFSNSRFETLSKAIPSLSVNGCDQANLEFSISSSPCCWQTSKRSSWHHPRRWWSTGLWNLIYSFWYLTLLTFLVECVRVSMWKSVKFPRSETWAFRVIRVKSEFCKIHESYKIIQIFHIKLPKKRS